MRTELIQDNQKVSEAEMRGKVQKVLYQRSKKQSIQKVNLKKITSNKINQEQINPKVQMYLK